MLKILAICGSIRQNSLSEKALLIGGEYLKKKEAEVEMLFLKNFNLPFSDGSIDYPQFPDVQRLRSSCIQAKGILFITPEYHGSISGSLKNAIDLLLGEEIAHKGIGIMSVVGGIHSTQAANTLRLICRQLHAWVIPDQLIISKAEEAFDSYNQFVDSQIQTRLEKFLDQFIFFAAHLTQEAQISK